MTTDCLFQFAYACSVPRSRPGKSSNKRWLVTQRVPFRRLRQNYIGTKVAKQTRRKSAGQAIGTSPAPGRHQTAWSYDVAEYIEQNSAQFPGPGGLRPAAAVECIIFEAPTSRYRIDSPLEIKRLKVLRTQNGAQLRLQLPFQLLHAFRGHVDWRRTLRQILKHNTTEKACFMSGILFLLISILSHL